MGKRILLSVVALCVGIASTSLPVQAAENTFSLQVSPSPLVTTIKPGESKTVELKIRNASTSPEKLKIEARTFTMSQDGKITLDDTLAPAFAKWLSLPVPGFTVRPGEWQTQKITINLPKDTGFSYSFALVISRSGNDASINNGRLLKGSVAVFTLINVDRPDAIRKIEVTKVEMDKSVYEYLPATVRIKVKNTGNTIVRPYGNIFIQQGNSNEPLATLAVNDSQAYLLPGTERTLDATWSDGFPVYQKRTDASGNQKTTLNWNLDHLRKFRIGQFTTKVVAIYNDGARDVPVEAETTFWVFPWKTFLLLLSGLTIIIVTIRFFLKRRTARAVKKALEAQSKQQ